MSDCSSDVCSSELVVVHDGLIDPRVPDLDRYTVPIMNYNIATAPLANADSLLPTDVAIADSRFVLNYFRLSADKRLIFGGGERYLQTPQIGRASGRERVCQYV